MYIPTSVTVFSSQLPMFSLCFFKKSEPASVVCLASFFLEWKVTTDLTFPISSLQHLSPDRFLLQSDLPLVPSFVLHVLVALFSLACNQAVAFRAQMHQCSSRAGSFKFLAENVFFFPVMSNHSHSSRHLRIVQNKPLDTGNELVFPEAGADLLW